MSTKFSKYVLKTRESGSNENHWNRYTLRCECADGGHEIIIDSYAADNGEVTLNLYQNLHSQEAWYRYNRTNINTETFKGKLEYIWEWTKDNIDLYKRRIKIAIKILFIGDAMFQGDMLILSPDHLEEFIAALTEVKDDMNIFYSKLAKEHEEWNRRKSIILNKNIGNL